MNSVYTKILTPSVAPHNGPLLNRPRAPRAPHFDARPFPDELALPPPLPLVGPRAELPAPPYDQPVGRQRRDTSVLLDRDAHDGRHSVKNTHQTERPRQYK